ncbi:MAG: hypothetical protein KAI24_13220 [Planctomycetes bacterium]|nr:hypothetical protein [Planctomycetota bacterium]
MKTLATISLFSLLSAPAFAQAQDIGLTMDGGLLTVVYGQDCGPVGCTPFVAGPVGVGQTRTVMHYSAPQTLYAVAIGFPGPCTQVPGFGNSLLLQSPVVIGWGLTSSPPFVPTTCQQGLASVSFTFPSGTPSGVPFRIQSFGQSLSGGFAFGPTLESSTY